MVAMDPVASSDAAGATVVAMTLGFNMLGWLLVVGFIGFSLLEPASDEGPLPG